MTTEFIVLLPTPAAPPLADKPCWHPTSAMKTPKNTVLSNPMAISYVVSHTLVELRKEDPVTPFIVATTYPP